MGRIPIYTSRATMRTGPIVKPHPKTGTEVSEAIGAFARTVGKVGEDWATQKASVEAQAEYANNTLLYKQAVNNNITVQSEDASIDPDDLVPNYKKSMQEVSGSLVWKSKLAQKQFELNKGNFDLGAEQRLNVLGRNRFIANIKAGYETSRKAAVDNGDLKGGLLALQAIESSFTPEQYKAEKIDLIHDVEYAQAGRALALDINADLKEFKNISKEEKVKLVNNAKSAARAEANRLKAERKENEKIYFEQTNDTFDEAFRKNELTMPEVNNSILPTKGEGGKIWWRKKLTTSPASESDISVVKDIRRKRAIGTLTLVDIDSKQDKLTRADYIRFSSEKKKRQKEIIDGKYIPSVFEEKSYMFMDELDRLVDNGTVTDKEAEEAKLKLPEQLYDRAMKEGFTEKQITDYSEFLIGSYLLKESQIRRDASAFKKFMSFMGSNVQGLIRESRREKRVEALPTEADFPTEEIEEEAIEIKDITPENVAHLSDWLKKNKKLVNEKNIRYLYEQLK